MPERLTTESAEEVSACLPGTTNRVLRKLEKDVGLFRANVASINGDQEMQMRVALMKLTERMIEKVWKQIWKQIQQDTLCHLIPLFLYHLAVLLHLGRNEYHLR